MNTKSNDQAFPTKDVTFGLTKREYFAAKALQGCLDAGFSPADSVERALVATKLLIEGLNKD